MRPFFLVEYQQWKNTKVLHKSNFGFGSGSVCMFISIEFLFFGFALKDQLNKCDNIKLNEPAKHDIGTL